jgi:hypothetical protein
MNSHAHNFAAGGITARPTLAPLAMLITSARAADVTWPRGCVSLKGEFVT